MALETGRRRKPAIIVSRTDHERLSRLAESVGDRNPAVADALLAELDRARVVADASLAASIVRMGSTLRFTTDAGEDRTVTLVYPGEADIARADMQHLDDVLRLEQLGLEAFQGQGRPVAAPVEGQPDAGLGQELLDVLLHPALGQGEMDDGRGGGLIGQGARSGMSGGPVS